MQWPPRARRLRTPNGIVHADFGAGNLSCIARHPLVAEGMEFRRQAGGFQPFLHAGRVGNEPRPFVAIDRVRIIGSQRNRAIGDLPGEFFQLLGSFAGRFEMLAHACALVKKHTIVLEAGRNLFEGAKWMFQVVPDAEEADNIEFATAHEVNELVAVALDIFGSRFAELLRAIPPSEIGLLDVERGQLRAAILQFEAIGGVQRADVEHGLSRKILRNAMPVVQNLLCRREMFSGCPQAGDHFERVVPFLLVNQPLGLCDWHHFVVIPALS